jgi:hypothetical protein
MDLLPRAGKLRAVIAANRAASDHRHFHEADCRSNFSECNPGPRFLRAYCVSDEPGSGRFCVALILHALKPAEAAMLNTRANSRDSRPSAEDY